MVLCPGVFRVQEEGEFGFKRLDCASPMCWQGVLVEKKEVFSKCTKMPPGAS